jgi:hypothetical protein
MPSNRHHYIPEFYIKGFTNPEQKVIVYDKRASEFKSQAFSPKQIFFEWNRNNLIINGKTDDFVENLYSIWDNKLSITYKRINEQKGRVKFDATDLFNLLIFVSLNHWRLPHLGNEIDNLIEDYSKENSFVKIYDNNAGEEVSSEFFNEFKKRPGFKEMFRLSRPITDYLKLDINKVIDNWKIYSAASNVELHILGDNPIIFKNDRKENILENELIMPLSKGKLLINSNGKRIEQITPQIIIAIDTLVFIQSKSIVIGSNKDYLKAIQLFALNYDSIEKIQMLKDEIFEIFK